MRILQLAPRLPYPLTDGGAIGIYKPTEAIARLGHEITFVTFPHSDSDITNEAVIRMRDFARVELVAKPLPSRASTILRTLVRGAYPIERRMMPQMFTLLNTLLSEVTYDLVHVDASHMGKYGMWIQQQYGLPIILREHNFETLIYRRFASNTRNPLAKIWANTQVERMLRAETDMIRAHDLTVAITPEDEAQMRHYVPDAKYELISAGVDTTYFAPEPTDLEEDRILWVGGMDWEPNRDAVIFFAKEIYPRIVEKYPGVSFEIVGSGTDQLRDLAANSTGQISVYGRVPDIRPFLAKAKVLVCPLRVGGGMRLKLLDFFAAGKAVVSTRIGAEGNAGIDGTHLLLREDAQGFADGVCSLLANSELRHTIGQNARTLVLESYSWDRIASAFDAVYRTVVDLHE